MSLGDCAMPYSMINFVDLASMLVNYSSSGYLRDRTEPAGEDDERKFVDSPVDQIDFVDTIIINRMFASSEGVKGCTTGYSFVVLQCSGVRDGLIQGAFEESDWLQKKSPVFVRKAERRWYTTLCQCET